MHFQRTQQALLKQNLIWQHGAYNRDSMFNTPRDQGAKYSFCYNCIATLGHFIHSRPWMHFLGNLSPRAATPRGLSSPGRACTDVCKSDMEKFCGVT